LRLVQIDQSSHAFALRIVGWPPMQIVWQDASETLACFSEHILKAGSSLPSRKTFQRRAIRGTESDLTLTPKKAGGKWRRSHVAGNFWPASEFEFNL
jgi:hypothetical protein